MGVLEASVYDVIVAQGKDALSLGKTLVQDLGECPQKKYAQTIETLCQELLDVLEHLHREGTAHIQDDAFWSQSRHLLRSPLNAIQGYAELLQEDLSEGKNPCLGKLVDISRRLLPLINSIHSLEDFNRRPDMAQGKNYNTLLLQDHVIRRLEIAVVTGDASLVAHLRSLYPTHGFQECTLSHASGSLVLLDGRHVDGDSLQQAVFAPGTVRLMVNVADPEKCSFEKGVDGIIGGDLHANPAQEQLGLWIKLCLLDANNRDLSARLRRTYEVLGGAVENLDDAFVMTDAHDRLVMCNTLFKRTYAHMRDLPLGSVTYEQFLQRHMAEGFYDYGDKFPQEWFRDHLHDRSRLLTTLQKLSDGRWIRLSHNRTSDGGMTSLHGDVTHERHDAERLTYLASHDALTNLPNRALLDRQGTQILETAMEKGLYGAVLYFDLDGFKAVNDTYGHPMGDALLVEVAHRLSQSCRSKDIVARMGGDEFAVVLGDLKNEKEAFLLAKRITKDIGTRFMKDGVTVTFAISMGLAIHPTDSVSLGELLIQADQAMYQAKRLGKGRLCAYRDVGKIAFLQTT